jgi:CDP-diacylglycerol--glycerol-3-phosphate 3-phosphatidyltransferase/cardiolipin synthase
MSRESLELRDALKLPGLLSLSRLPLAVAFPLVCAKPALGASVLAVAAATDMLDGFVARRLKQETYTGAVLDPIMDKAFVLGVAATLIATRLVTKTEAALLATREIVELPLVAYVVLLHVPGDRRANIAGKLTTVLQFVAVGTVLLNVPWRAEVIAATAIAGAAAGFTYWVRAIRQARAVTPRSAARARRSRAASRRAARAT